MHIKRTLLFLGTGWEILRFALVFFILLSLSAFDPKSTFVFLIIWFGSIQFVIAGGFFLTGLYPESYGNYSKLLALGKLLNIFPAFLILLFKSGLFVWGAASLRFALKDGGFVQTVSQNNEIRFLLPLVLIITLLDLIFFIFLILYQIQDTGHKDRKVPPALEVTVKEK